MEAEIMFKRLEMLEDRMHDHLVHYSNNNKTLALLSQRMDYFIQKFEEHDENEAKYNAAVDEHFKKLAALDIDKATELVDGYKGVMTVRNILLGLAAIAVGVGTLGAAIVGFTHLFKQV